MTLLSTTPQGFTLTRIPTLAKHLILGLAFVFVSCKPVSSPTPAIEGVLAEHYALIKAGQTGPARVRLRQLIDGGDSDSRTYFLMGLAHHWDRHYTKAAEWFAKSESAKPVYPPASHFNGWSLYHSGQPEASEQAFLRHEQLAPGEGDTLFGLGVLALERGEASIADQYFVRAISLQEDDPSRRGGVAKALARRSEIAEAESGDLDQAVLLLQKAIVLNDDLYESHFRLARLLRRLGRDDQAVVADSAGEQAKLRVESQDGRPR
jgi:tetratricopeptide (TPR) repeat protein